MSMESRGEGYGDEILEDISSGSKNVEGNKDKKDSKKKKDTEKKEKDLDSKQDKISLKNAHLISAALAEGLNRKKLKEPLLLEAVQIEEFRRILSEAGMPRDKVYRLSAKNLFFEAFLLLKNGKIIDEGEKKKDTEKAKIVAYVNKYKSISAAEVDEVKVLAPVSGGSGEDEAEEGRGAELEIDKNELLSELPDEDAVGEPLGNYIRELKELTNKNWTGIGELTLEQAKTLSNQVSEDIRKGELNRGHEEVQNVRKSIEKVSRGLLKQSRADEFSVRPREKEVYPLKNKITSDVSRFLDADEGTAEYNRLKEEIQAQIEFAKRNADLERGGKKEYRLVYEVTSAIRDADRLCSGEGGEKYDKFKKIISVEDLPVLTSDDPEVNILEKMNRRYSAEWRNMSDASQSALAGDIDQAADLYIQAILSGWRTLEDAKKDLNDKVDRKDDLRGFRQWRATEAIRGLETTIGENEKTRVPANPADISERLQNVFRQAEATGLSTEDLGPILNEGLNLVRAMPSSTGGERKRKEELMRRLESFRAVHVALIQLEKSDMDPNSVIKTFSELWEGKEEVTFEDFLTRYEEDDRGREFFINNEVEEDGEKKTKTEKANLFDEEFRLYSEQLRDERIKMNMIEEMTKHSISNTFSEGEIDEMLKEAGLVGLGKKLPEGWDRDRWIKEIEELREYFVEKTKLAIKEESEKEIRLAVKKRSFENVSVEDVWAKKNDAYIALTKNLVQQWHQKKTLHGAIGLVQKDDEVVDLAIEFRLISAKKREEATKEEIEKARNEYIGKQYLDIRRDRLVERFKNDLEKRGLKVNKNFSWKSGEKALEAANVDELSDKGYFESLDNTAYRMAWVMMWSNYDNIRIYARDKNSRWHDDYEKVVFHQSTNLFNARATDHLWEFYHKDNENRGRAKDNETNIIWKQFLPGKHHYMFPQNTLMVRWAKNFMSEEQIQILEDRKKEYMDKYDFHNPGLGGNKPEGYEDEFTGWMQSAVVMDMIESGEFSLGAKGFGLTDLAKKKQLKKFEFIDIYGDRVKNHKYANAENFQAYLADPTNARFAELNSKKEFYSTRSARQFPWMTLAMRAHWEIGNRHYKRIFDKENMQSVQMENVVNTLVASGNVEKKQGVEFKRKNLGFTKISPHGNPENLEDAPNAAKETQALFFGNSFFRRTRQFFELSRKSSWDYRFAPFGVIGAFFLGLFGDIIKRLPGQTTGSDK